MWMAHKAQGQSYGEWWWYFHYSIPLKKRPSFVIPLSMPFDAFKDIFIQVQVGFTDKIGESPALSKDQANILIVKVIRCTIVRKRSDNDINVHKHINFYNCWNFIIFEHWVNISITWELLELIPKGIHFINLNFKLLNP